MRLHTPVKGWFTNSPEQGHIAQVPLKFFSNVYSTIEVCIVFPTVITNKKSLTFPFSFTTTPMASSGSVCLDCSYHRYSLEHSLVFNHLNEPVIWHIAYYPIDSLAFVLGSLSDSCKVSQDYERIGGICEAYYFLADPMKNSVYATLFLSTNPFHDFKETSFLQSSPQPTVMPSYSSNFPAIEFYFHHTLLPQHRCGDKAFTQIYGKDRGAYSHFWSFNIECEHSNIPILSSNNLAFTKFPFRKFSMWLDGNFYTTPYTVNRYLEKPELLCFTNVYQIVSQTQGIFFSFNLLVIPQSLLLVGRIQGDIFTFQKSLKVVVFSVENFLFPLGQHYYSTLNSKSHSYHLDSIYLKLVGCIPNLKDSVLTHICDKLFVSKR